MIVYDLFAWLSETYRILAGANVLGHPEPCETEQFSALPVVENLDADRVQRIIEMNLPDYRAIANHLQFEFI